MFIKMGFNSERAPQFQIDHNPFNVGEDIPAWVKSRSFENEYEAALYLFVWLLGSKLGTVSQQNCDRTFTFILRLMQVRSKWAE